MDIVAPPVIPNLVLLKSICADNKLVAKSAAAANNLIFIKSVYKAKIKKYQLKKTFHNFAKRFLF